MPTSAGSSDGAGTLALFDTPYGITTDGVYLYVADSNNNEIRKIEISSGTVSTLAGLGNSSPGSADTSPSVNAMFFMPQAITTDGTKLYVADTGNHKIRVVQ